MFAWRFLNAVSYLDQSNFNVKTFTGEIEQVSDAILKSKKYNLQQQLKTEEVKGDEESKAQAPEN